MEEALQLSHHNQLHVHMMVHYIVGEVTRQITRYETSSQAPPQKSGKGSSNTCKILLLPSRTSL